MRARGLRLIHSRSTHEPQVGVKMFKAKLSEIQMLESTLVSASTLRILNPETHTVYPEPEDPKPVQHTL